MDEFGGQDYGNAGGGGLGVEGVCGLGGLISPSVGGGFFFFWGGGTYKLHCLFIIEL